MYRIELSPTEETVFRSIEELAVAIKRGVVTPRARIYHNASGRWLPIQFHPHYKVAVSMPLTQAALVAGPPVKPLSNLSLEQPADPEPPAVIAAPPPPPRIVSSGPTPVEKKRIRTEPAREKRSRRPTKSRRQLRIALVGALLVGGAQWVLSAELFSRSEAPALVLSHRRLMAIPVSPANTAAMVPVIRTPAPTLPSNADAEPQPTVVAPQLHPWSPPVESAAVEIQPAPSAIEVAAPAVTKTDSLAPKLVDSANKKALKGILRAVSGSPAKEKTPTKH